MKVVTLTRGGQVSIPAEYRRDWTSKRVIVEVTDRGLLLRPLPDDPIGAAMGSLKGQLHGDLTADEMMREYREEERAIEDRKWGRLGRS